MLSTCNTIASDRKTEIARILNKLNTLTEDLMMVFYLHPLLDFPTRRYTSTNPAKQLELIVITKEPITADQLLYNWILDDATQPVNTTFDRNLLILSEDEFIDAFNDLDTFRERVLAGVVVYDRDGDFLFG